MDAMPKPENYTNYVRTKLSILFTKIAVKRNYKPQNSKCQYLSIKIIKKCKKKF